MLQLLTDPAAWAAFFTLTALELVLGIDNIIFIAILTDRLPQQERALARRIGLGLAMFMRIGLLLVLAWIIGLTKPLFTVMAQEISGRDLILLSGGLFLLWKSTTEIHQLMEGEEGNSSTTAPVTFGGVIAQVIVLDAVFSLDSIITAVGMVDEIEIMVAAVVTSVALMMVFAGPVARFVSRHPTIKMLALSFLFMIGMVLIADGLGHHVPKGYIYFALVFSLTVEMLNLRLRKKRGVPVRLHERYARKEA
jgi:predicted tellurium resistance membrane protein TerC